MNKIAIKNELIKARSLSSHFWQGTVSDTVDPENHSRIRVEVDNLTEGIPNDKLPWYQTKQPFNSAGNAKTSLPPVASRVIVEFPTDDIYNGIVSFAISSKPGA